MKKIILFCLLLSVSNNLFGDDTSLERRYVIETGESYDVLRSENYDLLTMPNCDLNLEPGEPMIPVRPVYLKTKGDLTVTQIEITEIDGKFLEGYFDIPAAPQPQVLSDPNPENIRLPDESIFGSDQGFPSCPLSISGQCNLRGNGVLALTYYPVRYHPLSGRIFLVEELTYKLHMRVTGKEADEPVKINLSHDFERCLFAENPSDDRPGIQTPGGGEIKYLIITAENFVSAFEPLCEWKTAKGLPCFIQTVEWIESHCEGEDLQEKMRNYVTELYENNGLEWLLLGGDTYLLPARITFAMDCEAGFYPDENDLGADLYFSDLDGDWDADGDGIYGEVEDNVDLFPELFVGRAPVDLLPQAEAFVQKTLDYELNPPSDHWNQVLFLGEILWNNPFTDGGVGKDMIDDECFPPEYDPIMKLYESQGNETWASVMAALNDGKNIVNHDGHAFYDVMGVGDGYMDQDDMDDLINGDKQGLLYSIGCWAAAFDYDAVAEHFVFNPDGGGVAFVGNYRYGWGSPGHPGWGYSDLFDRKFMHYLITERVNRPGETLALTRTWFIDRSREQNVYRWHQYQLNLLGDPELPILISEPVEAEVSAPQAVMEGPAKIDVIVQRSDDGKPVKNARVCLSNNDGVYIFGMTDDKGQISLQTPVTGEQLRLVVTGPGLIPYDGSIDVLHEGAWLHVSETSIIDDGTGSSFGNADNEINAGETIELFIHLENLGQETATSVSATLTSEDPFVTVLQNTADFSNIPPLDQAGPGSPFLLQFSPDTPDAHTSFMRLLIEYNAQSRTDVIPLKVVTASIIYNGYVVYDDQGGDSDAEADPGETVRLYVLLKNTGTGWAHDITGELTSDSPLVDIQSSHDQYPDLHVNVSSGGLNAFNIHFDGALDDGCLLPFQLHASWNNDEAVLEFPVSVGNTGFESDMESIGGWTVEGGGWNLSAHRYSSGLHSFYCGIPDEWEYGNNWNCSLVSPEFNAAPPVSLSFNRWFQLPMYGSDGLFVEIRDNADQWIPLTFIGSGGALPLLTLDSDWNECRLDISRFDSPIQFRFRFESDDYNTKEGFYIDQVKAEGYAGSAWGSENPAYPTPTPTYTPPPTPTQTPLPKPVIGAAGWWNTRLTTNGGFLSFTVWAYDPQNQGIRGVFVLADGIPTDIAIPPMPGTENFFMLENIPVDDLPEGETVIQIAAQNESGVWSDPWPSLNVE